jgi:hypothetical protein
MIANMTGRQIREKLDQDHSSSRILAHVVCSAYWGGAGVDLRKLDGLDAANWAIAKAIMEYRRQPGWSDAEFYALACWCRIRHELQQWSHEQ